MSRVPSFEPSSTITISSDDVAEIDRLHLPDDLADRGPLVVAGHDDGELHSAVEYTCGRRVTAGADRRAPAHVRATAMRTAKRLMG